MAIVRVTVRSVRTILIVVTVVTASAIETVKAVVTLIEDCALIALY